MKVIIPVAHRECLLIAQQIVEVIRTKAPVRTGNLRDSYEAKPTPEGAVITSSAMYWKYVEFGTRRNKKQLHVRPSIEAVRAVHI
jgi:HK97 gp10 family phage protein